MVATRTVYETTRLSPTDFDWDPDRGEVTFRLCLSSGDVTCRVPDYVLRHACKARGNDPIALASAYSQVLVNVAREKVRRGQYERDRSVLIRLIDLPRPLPPPEIR